MHRILHVFFAVAILAVSKPIYSIDTSPSNHPTTLLSFINTTTEHKIKHSTLYLKANYLQHSGKYHQALKLYNDLFTLDAPTYVYDGFLRLLSQTNQFAAIVNLIDKTQDQFQDDLEIQIIYAQSLLNTNRDKQARELLEKLKQKYPDNEQIIYYSAAHNEKTNNIEKALQDINSFLARKPLRAKQFLFYFLKAKILLKMGNHDASLEAINKSLMLFPQFDKGILFKALLLEQAKQIDPAIECYQRYLQIAGHDPAIIKQLVQLLFSQQQFAQAATELKKLNNDQPEYYFDLALLEWKAKNHTAALHTIDKAFKKNPSFAKAKVLKIEIFASLGKTKEIIQMLQSWLIKEPKNNTLIKLIFRLSKKIIYPHQALTILQAAHENHKNCFNITLAMADLHLQTKNYPNAIENYKKTLALTTNNDLKAKISFQIGFIYFTLNNIVQATAVLEKALKEKMVYPPTYNLMAYMLAQSGKNLYQAIDFIEKALQQNPQSPYFLDTKAIILDRQGKHREAIQTFNQAIAFAPNDKIIQKHLTNAKQKSLQKSTARSSCPIPKN